MIYYNKIFHYKDSTTDTNETDANTVEMFSPPPPYPDELNYQFDLGGINNFEDEYRPFVPHLNANIQSFNPNQMFNNNNNNNLNTKYFKDPSEYIIEYASPINCQQQWLNDPSGKIYFC